MPSFTMSDLTKKQSYKLMTGSIVPRPIAWVSTVSEDGIHNLAPFSFFNGIAVMPPTLGFTVAYADDERGFKDTYTNLIANEECVVNIVTEATAYAMNHTAKGFDPTTDEFQEAKVTPVASDLVAPMRVAESPIQFECTLHQVVTLRNALGRSDLMLCSVLKVHVDDSVYEDNYRINQEALQAVGRMGGSNYINSQYMFDMTRFHEINDTTKEL